MFDIILQSPIFALFAIVALGYVMGRVKIGGISLDVSAVIFSALLFGHFGVVLPKELGDFGMALFIFTIGVQAGPGFFESFRSKGKTLIIVTVLLVASAALTALSSMYIFGLSVPDTVGLLTGALTSTPGLAAAKEIAGDSAAIAYGIAYPFGVIGVILFVKLLPKLLRINLKEVERELTRDRLQKYPVITSAVFRVTNGNIFSKSIGQLRVRTSTGAVISRIMHNEKLDMPGATTILYCGDLVKAVGTEEALRSIELLIGERVETDLPLNEDYEVQTGLLTQKQLVNKRLDYINLQGNFRCTITRVRRSGIDLTPNTDLVLKFGDKLTLLAHKEDMSEVLRVLGNDSKRLSDTDFLPISLGIVLGVLFGKMNLEFAPGVGFSPGLTGGILLTALILSSIGKTGPIIWTMSSTANSLLRQLGLILFLAGVGTSAGTSLVSTFMESGASMFGAGLAITLVPMLIATIVGRYLFKINILDLMGVITGGMTSTPGLAAADSMSESGVPSVAYATVYPVAMVFLILAVQLIATLF